MKFWITCGIILACVGDWPAVMFCVVMLRIDLMEKQLKGIGK